MSDDVRSWFPAVQFLLTIVVGIYAWVADRYRAHRDELDRLRADCDRRQGQLERSVERLSERADHVPSSGEVSELVALTRELRAELRGMRDQLGAISIRLDRHDEFLATRFQ